MAGLSLQFRVYALAWLQHRSPNVIVIPGTTNISHLGKNIAPAKIDLSDADFNSLSAGGTA